MLDLDLVPWSAPGLPTGNERAAFAFPCRSRARLSAFIVVAARRNGEALAPSQLSVLKELARAAGSAYEGIAADRAFAELDLRKAPDRYELPSPSDSARLSAQRTKKTRAERVFFSKEIRSLVGYFESLAGDQ